TTSDDPGSSITKVDLYAKGPADAGFAPVATHTAPDTSNFTYTATEGDGTYAFYTRASDGLTDEPDHAGADGSTLVDTTPPASQASAPASSSGGPIPISYSASDAGSGVQSVELWVKRPGSSSYALTDTDASPGSPSFSYRPAAGGGS